MTQLRQEAFSKVAALPEEPPDQSGPMRLAVVAEEAPLPALTDEPIAQVNTALAEAAVGHFAAADDVKAPIRWWYDGRGLIGLTCVGRATVGALHFNRERVLHLCAADGAADRPPPSGDPVQHRQRG